MVPNKLTSETIRSASLSQPLDTRPQLKRRGLFREFIETIVLIGAIYALVNLATARFIVDGASMQPNFATGQFLIVSRANYLFGQPEYGDIVVFHAPPSPEDDYIKRVVGLPGDTVNIEGGIVYVNGEPWDEPYIDDDSTQCRGGTCQWTLAEDEYFVMGDNRNSSSDSRSFGPVNRQFIVGEALVRYWPPNKWGFVEKLNYSGN